MGRGRYNIVLLKTQFISREFGNLCQSSYLSTMEISPANTTTELIEVWTLPTTATLGSSVRAQGILLEIRARLPFAMRKSVKLEAGVITLRMLSENTGFPDAVNIISRTVAGIDGLSVIPREVEDILAISSAERHRWLKDGRLRSTGTRTVKLRGRTKKVTFHVFDARYIEDLMDRDVVTIWRAEDVLAKAENRRRASGKAALTRAKKVSSKNTSMSGTDVSETLRLKLKGWKEFELDGLLR